MNRWLFDRRFSRDTGRYLRACSFAMLFSFILVGVSNAQTIESGWSVETRFYLSGMSFYWETDDSTTRYETVAATGELRFRLTARPWYASLFADYRFSTDGRHTDHVNLGGLFRYDWEKWDLTTFAFVNQSPRTDKTWLYAGRLRYRVAENHKIGLEAYGTFENQKSPQLMFGYYGSISDSLSLNLALGPLSSSGPDFSARLELIWQIL